ncbi:sensor histidine kinase [Enemella evansiae]|uniref:sensor histidine kinase n=1 Tax=Enemella evansiae TaxID=2016499 RepID=UPI00105D56FA|nr:histidine kinase [Enemella evansiae]TDO91911.1 signal transduction histidine kinase [Enemella evansiae]
MPRKRSLLIAGVVAIILLVIAVPTGNFYDPPAMALLIACCLLGGTVFLWPAISGVLLGVCLTLLAFTETQVIGLGMLAMPIAIATCAALGRRLLATVYGLWYFAASVAVAMQNARPGSLLPNVNFLVVFVSLPLIAGEVVFRLRQRQEKQRQEAIEAATEQRLAIARELHDTLAYATTTMVMKAEEARLRGNQDEKTLQDLDYIARTGRDATSQLRTMLSLLRDDSESTPLPSIGDSLPAVVQAQVDKLAAFGFRVECGVEGEVASMPPEVRQLAARVINEGASNISKHGDPTQPAQIMVDAGPDELEVLLVNAPAAKANGARVNGAPHQGLGLVGLRELAGQSGGELTAHRVGDHWITQLTVPLRSAAGVG